MKLSASKPASALPDGLNRQAKESAPVSAGIKKEFQDIDVLAESVRTLTKQKKRITDRRDELSERVTLSEKAALMALREYTASGEGEAAVDKARVAESEARKQMYLNNDSLGLVQSDLAIAEAEYEAERKHHASRAMAITKKNRAADKERFVNMMKRALLEILVDLTLDGLPTGQISLDRTIKKNWPTLLADVDREVARINHIVSHQL